MMCCPSRYDVLVTKSLYLSIPPTMWLSRRIVEARSILNLTCRIRLCNVLAPPVRWGTLTNLAIHGVMIACDSRGHQSGFPTSGTL
ncbi:hypothetical protein BTJ68_12786 [Hortaea werneckii EXF-2000]|uniref:Uncharacterized protein n=1 Tax=Hortaea werneckii EXF-2000 TaxID=1157616 RepID=A0A1Z5SV34_HORWE|nr:hypothetical protein BTJ68_12786 [Hortaea werneckii EXF-2000]